MKKIATLKVEKCLQYFLTYEKYRKQNMNKKWRAELKI